MIPVSRRDAGIDVRTYVGPLESLFSVGFVNEPKRISFLKNQDMKKTSELTDMRISLISYMITCDKTGRQRSAGIANDLASAS